MLCLCKCIDGGTSRLTYVFAEKLYFTLPDANIFAILNNQANKRCGKSSEEAVAE